MLITLIWLVLSIFLISVIFLRLSDRDTGLSSLANKTGILGFRDSAQKSLDYLTIFGIVLYLIFAFISNL
jgi:preprotein translocase subunit SecG